MGNRGAVGVRLNWVRRPSLPDVSSAQYRQLFANVRDLGWHVEIYLEGPLLANVLPVIRETGTKVVVDHFGSPDPVQGVACTGFKAVLRLELLLGNRHQRSIRPPGCVTEPSSSSILRGGLSAKTRPR